MREEKASCSSVNVPQGVHVDIARKHIPDGLPLEFAMNELRVSDAPSRYLFELDPKGYEGAVEKILTVCVDYSASEKLASQLSFDAKKYCEYSTTGLTYSNYLERRRRKRKLNPIQLMPPAEGKEIMIQKLLQSEMLRSYINPVKVSKEQLGLSGYSKLKNSYSDLCRAVAEFEHRASTLRTNSKAFILAKQIATQHFSGIFNIINHFPSSPYSYPIKQIQIINEFKTTCLDLQKELDIIDHSAPSQELNIFNGSDLSDPQQEDILAEYLHKMFQAFHNAQEETFIYQCHLACELIKSNMRSSKTTHGLDSLIKKQNHFRNSFMDFATVAIFFSSITATTLQFSFQAGNNTVPSTIVNLCWFASLVLSIASATNSLLGVLVHQSPEYLQPSHNLNFHILQNWFKYIPPMLLTFSGILFLVGFCAFTFLSSETFSNQGRLIQYVTATFTSCNFLALLVVFLFAFTRILQNVANFTPHLIIVTTFIFIALLVFPFLTLYSLIHHKSFPPHYRNVLFYDKEFGEQVRHLYDFYWGHMVELKTFTRPVEKYFSSMKIFDSQETNRDELD